MSSVTTTNITAAFDLAWPGFRLNVDLTLPAKGVTALFGHSGSGKTTLLRCIAGLERAAGRLIVAGEVWQDEHTFLPTHRRPLGMVFQEASLFPHLTVRGNLDYGRKRLPKGEPRQSIESIAELLGIGHLLERRPDRLSGGERQRVGIARALLVNPRLLLLDEPLAALDHARKQEILPYLERLRDELAIPMLYVSHAPDEVARLADYLVAIDGGQVRSHGPLAETLARIDLPILLGEDVGVVLDARLGAIDRDWHLAQVDFPGGQLWTRDPGLPPGKAVRVRVLARDVSLAIGDSGPSSIQNVLPGVVDSLAADEHPGLLLVRVAVRDALGGSSQLVARLTRRSADQLGIAPGLPVRVQVKSVALLE